jgi:murein DD-endopeptidase MepM/ murein hydrolase activator NlpD
MRKTLLAIAIVVSGLSGHLQAATGQRHQHRPGPAPVNLHKVRKGETAARIARNAGLTVAELGSLNPRVNLTRLAAGTVLKVGGARRLPSAAVPRVMAGLPREAGPAPAAAEPESTAPAEPASAGPVAPLPGTPALGPANLVHLERILPSELRTPAPAGDPGVSQGGPQPAAAVSSALTALRKVLPAGEDDDESAPDVQALTDPTGFDLADPDHLDLLWPVETRTISSGWGPRMRTRVVRKASRNNHSKRVIRRFLGSHKGVDLSAPMGTDIYAALDGKVVASGRHKDYGNFVAVDHGNGVMTLYAHCNRNFVQDGDLVRRGQKIAEVGRTGKATGPHLHFELRLDGTPQNPLPVMNDVEEIPADLMVQNHEAVAPFGSR